MQAPTSFVHQQSTNADGSAARLLQPGLRSVQKGHERYRVPANGAIVTQVRAGDRCQLVDTEGASRAQLACFDQGGRPASGQLGISARASAERLRRIINTSTSTSGAIADALTKRGVDPSALDVVELFGRESPAGSSHQFQVSEDGLLLIASVGEALQLDDTTSQRTLPASDLVLWIERCSVVDADSASDLPEPLADPRIDLRIDRMTAQCYEVKAGEFIQIIDVDGRECSDFQAFSVAELDRGVERPLDMTVTRSMVGAAYPGPGLAAKYFSADIDPLVEVIRDTVGRHDTFGLACTARYYEDIGYFGHPNCSDNFSNALTPFGVNARAGWEAVNLFYNTGIDENNVMYLDEPWSRPGDYVLLRALTDLVCVTSACPDDTSAANGWNPTDIHVRVYPTENKFSRAIDFRMKPDADPVLTRETGFHPRTSELTRNFVEYRGFWLPSHFDNAGAEQEYYACREGVIATDLSALRKFEVLGPDAEALLQWALTRNVRRLATGQVAYTAMCYEHGGMLDDGTAFRLGADNFRWIGGDEYGGEWLREQARARGLDRVIVKSSTDQIHNIAVQGPRSRELMQSIIWTLPAQTAVSDLQWFRFCVGRLGDFKGIPVMVSRTGYTGELGFEIFCHPDDAPVLWDAVWAAGEQFDIKPLGLDALDMLRIEAGLIFYGYEFSDQTDPFEAGIGFTVPLKSKEDDFCGREALLQRKAHPQSKLVGLELAGNEVAAHGDCVHVGRAQTGTVTSATRSPVLAKNIALCRMDVTHADLGTAVEVGKLDGHQKRIPATVVQFPFYDPDKSRVRS